MDNLKFCSGYYLVTETEINLTGLQMLTVPFTRVLRCHVDTTLINVNEGQLESRSWPYIMPG